MPSNPVTPNLHGQGPTPVAPVYSKKALKITRETRPKTGQTLQCYDATDLVGTGSVLLFYLCLIVVSLAILSIGSLLARCQNDVIREDNPIAAISFAAEKGMKVKEGDKVLMR